MSGGSIHLHDVVADLLSWTSCTGGGGGVLLWLHAPGDHFIHIPMRNQSLRGYVTATSEFLKFNFCVVV